MSLLGVLVTLALVPTLARMLRRLRWGKASERELPPHARPHGPGCQCNPESTPKVQYLRLVHNFCDRDGDNLANKRRMLSDAERAFVRRFWPRRTTLHPLSAKIVAKAARARSRGAGPPCCGS